MLGHIFAAALAVVLFVAFMGLQVPMPEFATGATAVWLLVLPFLYVVGVVLMRDPD